MWILNKKIVIAAILIFLGNVLCFPLWTELGYDGFWRTLFNKEARLELVYSGVITGDEPFHYQSTPKPSYSSWFYGIEKNVRWVSLNLRARGKWQKLSVQLEALRDGTITMLFRGADARDDYGRYYSIPTDWKNVKINGNLIFKETKALTFQKNFSKHIPVKKNEILHVEAEFRRHHFSIQDFTFLKSENLWYLTTGNLLVFFLIWRLFSLFGKLRGYLRLSDMLLVVTFFSLIFIPMVDISDEVNSVRENRMLAVKPSLKEILKGNMNTGGGYEKWFNDHFCGRNVLIKLHDVIRNKVSHIIRTEKAIFFKENGWDFLMPPVSNLDCKPASLYNIVSNLLQMKQFCQQHKIKLYILEVPKREIIYREILKKRYGFDEKEFIRVSRVQETIREKVRNHHIPYVYPYNELRDAAKHDFVFFKSSHHWTDWGAFVGYRELMKEIGKDFSDMPAASLNDYQKSQNWLQRDDYMRNYRPQWHFSQFFNDGLLDDHLGRTLYTYYDHKNADKMSVHVGKFTKEFTYPCGKHKIMLIGTSQNENFLQFIPYSAAQTKYIRLNLATQIKETERFKVLKLYRKDILAFKPEILILSISTDNLSRLRDLCSIK